MRGRALRKWRLRAGISTTDALRHLKEARGLTVAQETLFGWEKNRRAPPPDVARFLLELYRKLWHLAQLPGVQ